MTLKRNGHIFARLTLSVAALALAFGSAPARANDEAVITLPAANASAPAPTTASTQLGNALSAIRSRQWDSARILIDGMQDHSLAAFARAELYLAANSPRVDAGDLARLIADAPNLPQADQLMRLAQRRGVNQLPSLPSTQRLSWTGETSRRGNPRSVADPALGDLGRTIQARISADDPAGAEALLTAAQSRLSPAARTEWQQRVAWSYYIENDDANARRLAALAQTGSGDWVAQADWTQGLASWRQNDCRAAAAAFRNVAGRTDDAELEAAGHFWFARASTACGQAYESQPALRRAAALEQTFYGQLAVEALGINRPNQSSAATQVNTNGGQNANLRTAVALATAGETRLADELLRHQARIGAPSDHEALIALASQLSLPETQLFLAHNAPAGVRPGSTARFPAPMWTPLGGWRVNPALVFAHTLQESQFRARAVSPAGAVGLMQVRPGTAGDMGLRSMGGDLTNPATNMALGQAYIEYLRDSAFTGGLLPKVIAAYNAGPTPVTRWNSEVRDNGDPLLYIESLPYWETRAYVGIVLRNMWVYESEMGITSPARAQLAQGQWPRVPSAEDVATTRTPGNRNRTAAR